MIHISSAEAHIRSLQGLKNTWVFSSILLGSGEIIRAKIVSVGQECTTLLLVEDFHYDGILCLSLDAITDITRGGTERFMDAVFQGESILPPNTQSLHQIQGFSDLSDRIKSRFVMITLKNAENLFVKCQDMAQWVLSGVDFSSDGAVASEIVRLDIGDIESIAFENEYVLMYEKYAHSL